MRAEQIKAILGGYDISLEEMGKVFEVTKQTVYNWTSGRSIPIGATREILYKLYRMLDDEHEFLVAKKALGDVRNRGIRSLLELF